MDLLTISNADLDTIGNNLEQVADELNNVMNNVSTMNEQVTNVENQVDDLKDNIQNLMKEIRENTIVNNARQNVIYNNSIIEKEFGYYDNVRRSTLSLIDAMFNSNLDKKSIKNLRDQLILNNPDYWLTSAFAALSSWLLDDKEFSYKELNNALRKNEEKTSLFFCMIYLKIKRIDVSIKWLNRYLSLQNPMCMNKDFIVVLDLISTGIFGSESQKMVLDKIKGWFNDLNSISYIKEKSYKIWHNYILEHQNGGPIYSYLESSSPDKDKIIRNILISTTYGEVKNELTKIVNTNSKYIIIDDIIKNLVNDYEEREEKYKKDNLKNNLIIECNGDRGKALKLFEEQEEIYSANLDLITLLNNVIIHSNNFKISISTKKLVLSLLKNNIIDVFYEINKTVTEDEINFSIYEFSTKTLDGKNKEQIDKDLDLYLNNTITINDKYLSTLLIIINLIGISTLFLIFHNLFVFIFVVSFLFVVNIFLVFKISKNKKTIDLFKRQKKQEYYNMAEKILAQALDYTNFIRKEKENYNQLINYLNSLNENDFIKNSERNINIEG